MRIFRWPLNISLISLAVLPGLIALGFWQLGRAQYKEELSARLETRADLPAISNEWLSGDVKPLLLRRVAIAQGVHWAEKHLLLDNAVRQGRTGVEVVQLAEHKGKAFLVNRGWMPFTRGEALPSVAFTRQANLSGRLRPWPQAKIQLADAPRLTGAVNLVNNLNKASIETWLGKSLADAVIYLDAANPNALAPAQPPGGRMKPMQHYGYMAQWFALALALVGLNAWAWWRHRTHKRNR